MENMMFTFIIKEYADILSYGFHNINIPAAVDEYQRQFQDKEFLIGMYSVLFIDNCKKEGCFPLLSPSKLDVP
jgi:hypothetical protein